MTVLTLPIAASPPTSGITDTDMALARVAMAGLPGAWSAAAELGYDGNIVLVLMPKGDDAAGPSFHIERGADGIELGACRWDRFARLGTFPSMRAALDAAIRHLAA